MVDATTVAVIVSARSRAVRRDVDTGILTAGARRR
jgi:hypothetical protein